MKTYSLEEKRAIVQRIDQARASGSAMSAAAHAEGLKPYHYHNWKADLKRSSGVVIHNVDKGPTPRAQKRRSSQCIVIVTRIEDLPEVLGGLQ